MVVAWGMDVGTSGVGAMERKKKKNSMEVVLRQFYSVSLPSALKFQPGLGSAALAKAKLSPRALATMW